jgi:hypothetical protein
MTSEPSQPRPKPKLAQWLFDRDVKPPAAAAKLGVSPMQVRRYLLPFHDPRRQIPGEEVLRAIVEWTAGEVTVADFYPPDLSGRPGDRRVLAAAGTECPPAVSGSPAAPVAP